MKRQYLILAVSFMICYNLASSVSYTDCGSQNGKITFIGVSGCLPSSKVCDFMRNTTNPIEIHFNVSEVVTKVRAIAHFQYQNRNNSLLNEDGCVKRGLKCPLQKDTHHIYYGVLIASEYPEGQVSIISKLLDQKNGVIVCAQFPAIFH